MEAVLNNLPLYCTLVGAFGVLFAISLAAVVKKAPAGDEKMQEIAAAIQEGAIAYLNRQLKSMGIAGAVIFIVIFATMGAKTAIGFLVGDPYIRSRMGDSFRKKYRTRTPRS